MVIVELLVPPDWVYEDQAVDLVGRESLRLGVRVRLMIREIDVGSPMLRVNGRHVDPAGRELVRTALESAVSDRRYSTTL